MKYATAILLWSAAMVALVVPAANAQNDSELPDPIYLYSGDAPGSEGRSQEAKLVRPGPDRVVSNVHRPLIYPYLPDKEHNTGMAVVIAPGGGHRSLWTTHEGHNPAAYFAEQGIASFVLEYRLAEEPESKYTVDDHALGDLQTALRVVRSRAEEWGIDPHRVGAMGFSAGGELVALSGMRFDQGSPERGTEVDAQSSRPDFLALIYPGRSHRFKPHAQTPPTFIAAGFGDRKDISEGMADVYLKCKRAGVPAELHLYSEAGHGFGLRQGRTGAAMKWVDRFVEWAADRKLITEE